MAEVTRLSSDEISKRLSELSGWRVDDGKLTREFQFNDFMEGVEFVNRVARVAEAEGHHPDLYVTWGRVTVQLTSHSAGGLTINDFKLASLIEQI